MVKRVQKKKPPVAPTTDELQTGAYALDKLRQVIKAVTKREVAVTITVPRSVAHDFVPILSPNALRFVDFACVSDSHFPKQDTFVLEVGRRKFLWK